MRRSIRIPFRLLLPFCLLLGLCSCGEPPPPTEGAGSGAGSGGAAVSWAIAIHGGAGSRPPQDEERRRSYLESLQTALGVGEQILREGGSSLDAVEQVLIRLEDDPNFNAGKGAVFNRDGVNELDASIMDGATLECGAVAGVRTVRNPIALARLVMERTPHVLLAGEGAERFARAAGAETVPRDYFHTAAAWERLQRALESESDGPGGGTVGAVALDQSGNLAAGTTTGGLTAKMPGRIGDTPIVGAGTYADNRSCAVSCTGKGEEFIRRAVAYRVATLVGEAGLGVAAAAEQVVHDELAPGDGGLIVVGAGGEIAMVFNTPAMYRGAADSRGRSEVWIEK